MELRIEQNNCNTVLCNMHNLQADPAPPALYGANQNAAGVSSNNSAMWKTEITWALKIITLSNFYDKLMVGPRHPWLTGSQDLPGATRPVICTITSAQTMRSMPQLISMLPIATWLYPTTWLHRSYQLSEVVFSGTWNWQMAQCCFSL